MHLCFVMEYSVDLQVGKCACENNENFVILLNLMLFFFFHGDDTWSACSDTFVWSAMETIDLL